MQLSSSNNPLVSVCIPAYNCEKYIGETINCLLNQTYKNLEVIVVDDGSTDGSRHILKSVEDKRFKYINQTNKGASAARNEAYRHSTGDYIKFLDADDLLNNSCIESQVLKILNKPDCLASAKWGRFYNEDATDFTVAPEKIYRDLPGIDWLIDSLIETGANMMGAALFLVPRNIIEKAGMWNEELSLIDDFDFMARVLTKSPLVLFCDNAVLMYRSGVSNNLSGKTTDKHMYSAFNAVNLGIRTILAARNDRQSRRACANTIRRWSYTFYPAYKELYDKMEMEIDKLGGADVPIMGGKFFTLLASMIGWKKAKKLKMLLKGNG